MKLVIVTWRDSNKLRGVWHDMGILGDTLPEHCVSVGWVVKDTPECLTIIAHKSVGDKGEVYQGGGDMCIPKKVITRMEILRKK